MKRIFVIILLLCIIFGVTSFAEELLKSGSPIPSFKLPDVENKIVNLDIYIGKKPLIISFFASWSKSCVDEIKYLKSLSDNFEIIAVSFDNKTGDVQTLINREKIPFTVLIDKKGEYIDDFQILIIPKLFIVDKNGYIAKILDDFDENIQKLIDKEVKKLADKK